MKKFLSALLALALVWGLTTPALGAAERSFYKDVPDNAWYSASVHTLFDLGVLPGGESFGSARAVTRLEFIRYLYRLHQALGGRAWTGNEQVAYTDVSPQLGEGYRAVVWATYCGISNGVSPGIFGPDGLLTREQCCTLLCRFAVCEKITLAKVGSEGLFRDSIRVSGYARTAVAACKMAGLIAGYGDGTVVPNAHILRGEAAAMLERLYRAAKTPAGGETVSLWDGAYHNLYARYDYRFGDPLPQTDPVGANWFDDAVFIGDSVTVRLEMYCSSTKALGKATFLCTTSLSAPNALANVTSKSLHPTYKGVKQKVEDSVAACGAKNVYIMLGINSMRNTVASSTSSLVTLIGKITEKSPKVNIFIQSVTPMTATSNIVDGSINNIKILQYNNRMRELCAENGWYYLDVASQFRDANGNLIASYCSDPKSMGIHFTSKAAGMWCDYLKSHVPEALKAAVLPTAHDRVEEPPAPEETPQSAQSKTALEQTRDAMLTGLEELGPLRLDRGAVEEMYLLQSDWVAQAAGFIIMSGVFPDEVVLVEATSQEAAAKVAQALQTRLDEITRQASLYDQESYALVQQCQVVTEGLLVHLIIARNPARYISVLSPGA